MFNSRHCRTNANIQNSTIDFLLGTITLHENSRTKCQLHTDLLSRLASSSTIHELSKQSINGEVHVEAEGEILLLFANWLYYGKIQVNKEIEEETPWSQIEHHTFHNAFEFALVDVRKEEES